MSNYNLSKAGKVTRVMDSVTAGTSDQNSTNIDMQGFNSVLFITSFGVITSSAVTSVKLQTSTDNSSFSDLLGSDITVADSDDTSMTVHDLAAPQERYIRLVVLRGTQNAIIDGSIALQYNAKAEPTTHDATTVIASELHVSPARGTP